MSTGRAAQLDTYEQALGLLLAQLSPAWLVREHEDAAVRSYLVHPFGAVLPDEGWKLHISCAYAEAVEFCGRVIPFLLAARASFKIARDSDSIFSINSGRAGATQVGKILTVYLSMDRDLGTLATQLSSLWENTKGPTVPSDLRVSGSGTMFLRYGAIATTEVIADRLGRHATALRRPDGVQVPDVRTVDGLQPVWAPPPPIPCHPASEVDINSRFRIGTEEFLPMVCLNSALRGLTYLGISLDDGRSVVLKTARRGICWDPSGYDAVDLLYREYQVLCDLSRHRCLAPLPIGFIRGDDLAVLAMEDVKGEPLEAIGRELLIELLPELGKSIARLHACGYVHRDIKLSNAVVVDDAVRLVDFSLATATGRHDITGGTRNHMAPESLDGSAAPAEDSFSFGVAVAGAFLGRDPALLPAPPSRLIGLLNLLGWRAVSSLVAPALGREPQARPTPTELAAGLADEATRLVDNSSNPAGEWSRSNRGSISNRMWCLRASGSAGVATRQFLEQEGDKGWWLNRHFEEGFRCEGINLGAAGIILGLIGLDHARSRDDFREDVTRGCNWLATRPVSEEALGLLSGDAGVALALGIAGRRFARADWIDAARVRLVNASRARADYDFFSGTAGVLYAASTLGGLLEEQWPKAVGSQLADRLVRASRRISDLLVWPAFEESHAPLIGAAHGSAGVALALAAWSRYSGDMHARDLAIDAFSRIFNSGKHESGGLMRSLDENPVPTDDQLWCHGAAGYIWCIMVGLGDEPLLREAIDWGVKRFLSSTVLTSPVYCHGLAGQLDLCASLGGIRRLRSSAGARADLVAGTLRLLMERRNGSSVWTSEEPETITPDLWIGFLGPAVALAAYARASEVSIFSPDWLIACSIPPSDAR